MGAAVKKTISLPADLARDAEALARAKGKTLSAVIQDALPQARIERRLQECAVSKVTGATRPAIKASSPSRTSSVI